MILTNNFNLPAPIVDAIKGDPYHFSGDISCSQLFDEPQIRILKKIHKDEITTDASEMVFSLLGQSVHTILERSMIKTSLRRAYMTVFNDMKAHYERLPEDKKGRDKLKEVVDYLLKYIEMRFPETKNRYLFEIRLEMEFEGMIVSGQFDLFDTHTNTLSDYKVLSTFAYMFPHTLEKFKGKMNLYALMLRNEGYTVDKMELVLIFRDYSSSGRLKNRDYPPSSVITVPVSFIDDAEMHNLIHHRVRLHKMAEEGEVAPCSGSARWSSAETWAVMKKGLKKALSTNHTSEKMAQKWIDDNAHMHLPDSLFIDWRPGENRRCASYCPVSKFCPQYEIILKKLNT